MPEMTTELRALVYVTSIDPCVAQAEGGLMAPPPELSGVLAYRDGSVMHFLEGPSAEVRGAVARSELDPSTGRLIVLSDEPVAARELSVWCVARAPSARCLVILPDAAAPEVRRWLGQRCRQSSDPLHLLHHFLLRS